MYVCFCVSRLFQAILSRKLVVPEMEQVMKKVAKLSVTGSNAMIRNHCRQVHTLAQIHCVPGDKAKG